MACIWKFIRPGHKHLKRIDIENQGKENIRPGVGVDKGTLWFTELAFSGVDRYQWAYRGRRYSI